MHVPTQLQRLAAAQDGIVTRRQALEMGVSKDAIRYALGRGQRWQRIVKGVYATFIGPLQERHLVRAALLFAGSGAVLTGSVACRAYGMRYVEARRPLILVDATANRTSISIADLRRTRLLPRPTDVRSFACAPPARAAIDACSSAMGLRAVRATLCEVVQRGLATPAELVETATRIHKHKDQVRQALADIVAGCRSAPECELRDLVASSDVLPQPAWNQPLADDPSVHPDGCWAEARLVVEVDSVEWHRFGDRPEQTERRRARYAALGYRVIPVSPRRLREEPQAVLAEIEAAYLSGRADVA